jgi:hypothetical protein
MSEATIEALESEAYEGEGEAYGEGGYEGEAYGEAGYEGEAYGEGGYEAYGESARSDARRRRARQQQIAAARRARLRRPPAPPPRQPAVTAPRPSQRQAMTAIRSADRDLKMELDSLRRQLAKARRNGNMAMYSAVLSAVGSQSIDTFGDRLEKHDVVKAAVRAAPLGLLWPQHGRKGVEGVLLHPAFIGAVGIAAIVISGKVVSAPHAVDSISVVSPVNIEAGESRPLSAFAVDRKGNEVPNITITFTPQDENIATVKNGVCTVADSATTGDQTVITAAGGGATGRIIVNVP